MSAAAQPQTRGLAPSLLVEHVHRLDLGLGDRLPARARLEQALGAELAYRLLYALTGEHAMPRVP